ncbi:MAG: ThuA domain-containing protein [Pirellulaceae bacterium]|nr:ThuA domain-containing protein [Planctomycetales bacterium]
MMIRRWRFQVGRRWRRQSSRWTTVVRVVLFGVLALASIVPTKARDLKVLFLGDQGHHRPDERFAQLQPVLQPRGIRLTYTENMNDINLENLRTYDVLLLYANIDNIEASQADAILAYVDEGHGFAPLHCATYCFRNSPEMVALMGAQFRRHGTGVFRDEIALSDHPIMRGFSGFESWDETYVHHLHNEKDRTVLSYRVDQEGREPWTWVRTHGKGRVFYTAWGHDQRTWGNVGFQNLVERGIRWAAGDDPELAGPYQDARAFPIPEMTPLRKDVQPFEYVNVGAKIPFYPPSGRWGDQDRPMQLMQKPLPAEESLKHIVTPKDFHVELFVADPQLEGKPICMTWDERGRLWISETYDYPNELQPPGEGRDRIRICEDTDGDWKADKFTVFAEKLSIPASITFYRGGVIVQNGIETLYLKDTDGDDVADEKRVLFTGWEQGDTHGGVSNFQYGLDNWIWAMQGYNDSRPAIDEQQQAQFRQGFFRFQPDGSRVEFIRSTNNNTWGLGISEEGIIFGSTANRNPSVYMPIANRYYERVRGWNISLTLGSMADTHLFKPITDKIRQVDHHGGYTAGAGHALYTARNYPREYWNRAAFVNGPTGHLTGAFVITGEGSDFKSTNPFNLLASDDEWTAPIMAEVGPDGNVWIVDWYNFIVQHNPTPRGFETGKGNAYESDLRDKKHGRIYRVVHDKAPAKPFSLKGASPAELVATLRNPNMFWRKQAQRLLVERGDQDVVQDLLGLVRDASVDEIGLNVGAIHALWTLHGLGAFSLSDDNTAANAVLRQALRHPSAGVRRNAVMVLPATTGSVDELLAANVMQDQDAQVRLAAMLALSDLPPHAEAGPAIVAAMARAENRDDRWIPQAATSAAAMQATSALPALTEIKDTSPTLNTLVEVVANHVARSEDAGTMGMLIQQLRNANPEIAQAMIRGLANGWPVGQAIQMDDSMVKSLDLLLESLPVAERGKLAWLASSWGGERFRKYADQVARDLTAQLNQTDKSEASRIEAARQLIAFRSQDPEAVRQIVERLSPQISTNLADGFLDALSASEVSDLGSILLQQIDQLSPAMRSGAFRLLLGRLEWTKALLDAAEKQTVSLTDLSLDQRQSLTTHSDVDVRRRTRALLASGGVLPDPDRQKVVESLMAITEEHGDATLGKEIFKKTCSICHMHSGEGSAIGPDLTGMAVHPKHELLIHILDPSRSVEGNFRIYRVETKGGRILNGMLGSESRTSIELIDAEGKKTQLSRDDIELLSASKKSLMPEGFEKQLTAANLKDLLEFLTVRGKYVPLDLRKVATICSDRGMFTSRDARFERITIRGWEPQTIQNVPFQLIDPKDGEVPNCILLYSPVGGVTREMPRSVSLPVNGPVKAIHLLSGIAGWGFPSRDAGTVSMTVRIHYAGGEVEEQELINGEHFADYVGATDVPKSQPAIAMRGRQIRFLSVAPQRSDPVESIEFVKGADETAPIIMAATVETNM